jgi:hypothetical protein
LALTETEKMHFKVVSREEIKENILAVSKRSKEKKGNGLFTGNPST